MKTINELIRMGFTPSILEGNVKLHYRGTASPDIKKAQPLLEELKLHKNQAIQYIEKLIIYEIYDDINFDIRIQTCLNLSINNHIEWLRIYIYKKSKKVILIGQGHDP